ncbi:PepSY domain-containing protein [Neobacillus niacini]|uniref:PepSY domain-containing protein n=1 Tax=Neobacillus niacini TaxID=86668 RepID=UPI002FFF606D
MNLFSILLTGSLITGVLGANTLGMFNYQQNAGQIIETSKTIGQINAKEIAIGETKGGVIKKSKIVEENGMKKYEITIIKQNGTFDVEINAKTGEILDFKQEIKDKTRDVPKDVSTSIS